MKHSIKRTAALVLTAVASFLLIVSVLFTCLQLSINDRAWFEREYEKLGLAEKIGIPNSDSADAIMRLIDYMEGRENSIQLTVHQNGVAKSMYNEREMEHMTDVRALYQAWRSVRTYGAIFALALLFGAFFLGKKEFLFTLAHGFLRASAAFGILLIGIGLFAFIDFNAFWTAFHHLFFTNDLWLLDPATDRMILICPEQLFSDIVLRFASRFLLCFALMLLAAFWAKFKGKARYGHER
ncbi:MAG TPA: TIGR01906 family membrane protein [Clostridia bacterium]|nr:TIGR01906 family membrane protein [Clostridia bacterium]